MYTYTLYTLYIYRRYKHMYIHSVIQAYKSVHAQCRWRDPRAGHAQVCAGRRHTWGCPEPCVQKTQTQSVSRRAWLYKFTSKLRHFKEPYNLDWKWDKGSIWASARPAPTFPGSQGHYPPPPGWDESEGKKMTFRGLDLEKSWNVIYSPTVHEALSTSKWVTSFWTLIWSGPGTRIHSQGLAEDRQRAGWGQDCSIGNSPKGLGCFFFLPK